MARLQSLVLLLLSTFAADDALAKEFVVGQVGPHRVEGVVADEWVVGTPPSPTPAAATARLSLGELPDVVVLVTVLMPPSGSRLSAATAATVSSLVSDSAIEANAHSVEKNLTVEAFTSGEIQGSYFSATDKAPLPGEFKYMSQGVATFGELAVTFTALSHADPVAAKDFMLAIVGSLRARQAE